MKTKLIVIITWLFVVANNSSRATPPRFLPTQALQNDTVDVGASKSFSTVVVAEGPLKYQWQLNGGELLGQTNQTLTITSASPADEGDYSVVVSNSDGVTSSVPARLWVVPPSKEYIARNFTNSANQRVPYFYFLPTNFDAGRRYPLIWFLHGSGDEGDVYSFYLKGPWGKVFSSYRQQLADPAVVVWPSRRIGDKSWDNQYMKDYLSLLDMLIPEFSIDTNRIYLIGISDGVGAAHALVGRQPQLFAASGLGSGGSQISGSLQFKDVPTWIWCSSDDGLVSSTRVIARSIRFAGGRAVYTEYKYGGHDGGIVTGLCNPVYVNWMLAQRRGVESAVEPRLSITNPSEAVVTTGALILNLAGKAEALGMEVTQVSWEAVATKTNGVATGYASGEPHLFYCPMICQDGGDEAITPYI